MAQTRTSLALVHTPPPRTLRLPGRPRAPRTAVPVATLLLLAAAACTQGDSVTAGRWEASVDTVADTVVVRTVAGSVWEDTMTLVPEVEVGVLEGPPELIFGRIVSFDVDPEGRIWIVDQQIPELRVFAPDGRYLMTAGRPGEGPGELQRPDGGLAVLSDGRVLVRDPANSRLQLFGPEGEPLETWPIRGNFNTSNPLWKDRDDNVYTQILLDPEADVSEWRTGLAQYRLNGTLGDTLVVPEAEWEEPFLEGRSENSVSRNSVPFTAGEDYALHPDGDFMHGIGDDYSFTLLRDPAENGQLPLRIERSWDPVPVASGEADEARERATANMRRSFPGWRWNGPGIPDAKPAFRNLLVGRDGRIWVQVSLPGHRVEDLDHDPTDPTSVPDSWDEGTAFDVFEPDGRYLGHVRAPGGFSPYPTPRFDGERVWAVVRDDLGVQRLVRFRLEPAGEAVVQ